MSVSRRQQGQPYDTIGFTAALAAREAALGITQTTQELYKPMAQPDGVTPAEQPAEPGAASPLPGSEQVDGWGNAITSPRGWYGQYTIISQWTGKTVYVCGDIDKKHEQRTHWRQWKRDGRRERGQGWICPVCHVYEAGLYGIFER